MSHRLSRGSLWFRQLALLLVGAGLLLPGGAGAAQPADLPPLLVGETEAELAGLGCRLHPANAPRQATGTQLRAVIGSDATGERLAWCPAAAVGRVTIAPRGSVAGIADAAIPEAQAAYSRTGAGTIEDTLDTTFVVGRAGDGNNVSNVEVSDDASLGQQIFDTLMTPASWLIDGVLSTFFSFLGYLATVLLRPLIGSIIVPLLSLGTFVTSPLVTALWPLALGVANMGFVIALLVIALLTALRVESGGARRMLPRLFIGALLVNFSLVVGGVIMDFTRLVMAVLLRVLAPTAGGATDNFLSVRFFQSSGAAETSTHVAQLTKGILFAGYFDDTIGSALAAFMLWILVLAAIVLAAGLVMRYLALLVLLAVSPFAYLFLAFPNTGRLANQWWTMFLRYAFYAPVVLVILLGGIRAIDTVFAGQQPVGLAGNWLGVMKPAALAAIFYMAAKAGSMAGVAGSAAAMSFFNKNAKRVGGGIGRTVGKGAYYGSGAALGVSAAKGLRNQGRDALTGLRGAARQRVKDRFGVVPAKRDDKGRLQKGEQSLGLKAGERILGGAASRKEKDKIKTAATVLGAAPRGADGKLSNADVTLQELRNKGIKSGDLNTKAVKNSLKDDDVISLAGATDKPAELRALAGDKEFLKGKGAEFRINLAQAVESNTKIEAGPAVPTVADLTAKGATAREAERVRADLLAAKYKESQNVKENVIEAINQATRDKENA